jgi:cyclophilin family peptidyl-prolyl cis-trans isomerase/HEAT repeat protein
MQHPRPHLRRQPGLVVLIALLLAGCASPRGTNAPAAADRSPLAAAALPEAPGDLLAREDLQRLVERQARRDTLALVTALFAEDPVLRARAALGLGSVRAAAAVPALVPLLVDTDARVRAFAAFALGQSGDAILTGPLLDALRQEQDLAVLRQLLDALGRTGDRSALAALAGADLPPALDPFKSLAIARFGIRNVHDPVALAHLARGLASDDPEFLRQSAYFFARVADTSSWRDQAADVLRTAARLAPDHPAQQNLAAALGRLDPEQAGPALTRLLRESPDWRTRVNAARGLSGAPAGSDAAAALLAALDDLTHHVAVAAAQTIGASGAWRDEVTADLARWMAENDDRWEVWTGFLPALPPASRLDAARGNGSLPAHVAPFARAAGLRSLATAPEPEALGVLVDAAADPDSRVAYAALETLVSRWNVERSASRAELYFPIFSEALRRADVGTVYAVAPVLADSLFLAIGSGDVMRETYAGMEVPQDVEPMTAIVRAHGAARDPAALDFLLSVALEGPHPVLRRAAAESLDRRFGEGIQFEATGLSVPAFPRLDWDYLTGLGATPRLVLETDRGRIVLEMFTHWAPVTVQTIARLASGRKYDGVPFHRVVPNFVVQGGDFARADGFGGPEYFLPSEFTTLPYTTGTLGMASAGPDTEGSQFFVTHSPQPHLDGRYTVFGRILEGQEVVDELRVGDRIVRARVEASR